MGTQHTWDIAFRLAEEATNMLDDGGWVYFASLVLILLLLGMALGDWRRRK